MKTLKMLIIAMLLYVGSMASHAVAGVMSDTSLALQKGMTEMDIAKLFPNRLPYGTKIMTCGEATGNPITCKMIVYGTATEYLDIFLQWKDGKWIVFSWLAGTL